MTLIYFVSNYPTKAVICEITNSPSCTGSSSCSTLVGALAGSVAGAIADGAATCPAEKQFSVVSSLIHFALIFLK